ncbi:phage holin family protein [Rathayibacter sp. YIM 133350]|uniref:phage holin family protein n=1 Tax=Rathayibacter sp. YIM 133350 TaxID=3131992 RepID=UPI00307F6F02
MVNENNPKLRRSLFELLSTLPDLLRDLIRAEVAAYKAELVRKGKNYGAGAGLFAAAAFLLFWVFAVLIASAVLAFTLVLPGWAAALVVAGILLVIIVVLVVIGISRFKAGAENLEEPVKEAIQHDVDAVKGTGQYD